MTEITLPTLTRLKFSNEEGVVLLEEEAIYLDSLLGKSQEMNRKEVPQWLPIFTKLLNDKHGAALTDTQAFGVALSAEKVIALVKKNTTSIDELPQSTGSTLSPSVPNNSTDSTPESEKP